jgi:hypothetical protein
MKLPAKEQGGEIKTSASGILHGSAEAHHCDRFSMSAAVGQVQASVDWKTAVSSASPIRY